MFGFGKHKAEARGQAKMDAANSTIHTLTGMWASMVSEKDRSSPEGVAMLMGMVDSAGQAMSIDAETTIRMAALALIPALGRDAADTMQRMRQANRDPAMLFWMTAGGRAVATWLTASSSDGGAVLFKALSMIASRDEINARLAVAAAAQDGRTSQ